MGKSGGEVQLARSARGCAWRSICRDSDELGSLFGLDRVTVSAEMRATTSARKERSQQGLESCRKMDVCFVFVEGAVEGGAAGA